MGFVIGAGEVACRAGVPLLVHEGSALLVQSDGRPVKKYKLKVDVVAGCDVDAVSPSRGAINGSDSHHGRIIEAIGAILDSCYDLLVSRAGVDACIPRSLSHSALDPGAGEEQYPKLSNRKDDHQKDWRQEGKFDQTSTSYVTPYPSEKNLHCTLRVVLTLNNTVPSGCLFGNSALVKRGLKFDLTVSLT